MIQCVQPLRIDNPEKIDRLLIGKNLKDGKQVIIQYSHKIYNDQILETLNELCLEYEEGFCVRFYGHYDGVFDCNTLLKLPNVKDLSLDCLTNIDNWEVLTTLKHLKSLHLGVFELKETSFLKSGNFYQLEKLIIGETRKKAVNLEYLEKYRQLNDLVICGHNKNIEVVGELLQLEHLCLNSISKTPLDFVNKLKNLKSLQIILGGRDNIDEIEGNEIERLDIIRVRGFNSFKNISNFQKLRSLSIQDQAQLIALDFDREISTLQILELFNCKNLKSLTGIDNLNALVELSIYKTDINFDAFIKQAFSKSLDRFRFLSTNIKTDKEIAEKLLQMGYKN